MKMHKVNFNPVNIIICIGLIAIGIFAFYCYEAGIFSTSDVFIHFVKGFGIWSVLIFILIQVVSVIISIIPTSIGCIAGILIFGPWYGFLYNYIGICIGSIVAFLLAKRYGTTLVRSIISNKYYDKYVGSIDGSKNFDRMFALAIFFPVAPDDILCYIAGLTEMKLRKFIIIIILGKPFSLAIYSLGLTTIIHYVTAIIK